MLSLDRDLWAKLSGPYGSAEDAPRLLQQLQQQFSQEVFDELFQEYLFHQNTIYTATYAAMPFLARLACTTSDSAVRKELYINCGIIEASRDERHQTPYPPSWTELADEVGSTVCTQVYTDYVEAIDQLRSLTEQVLTDVAELSTDDTEKRYVLIADAAFRESYIVANMLMTFSDGDEYVAECPACANEVYIWPDEHYAVPLKAYEQDPVFQPDQEAHAIIPASIWTDEETGILAERTAKIGEQTLSAHLPYLAGKTTCPSCHENIAVWPALLSTFIM
ncbi:hypothetical protein M3629_19915 [Paenibacillus polysaccharolyticus]|uniref:hypothetical protein n=1 Tax=Paenibacillus polysaccharolyticus TaxID=582692 RepID=UPI00203FBB8A|nr:hypothetical protein [Paenibacillus polysaccharolyticus]MCM3135049.1 hypothetical protein [Paenibacillus polysaccharolyticus]